MEFGVVGSDGFPGSGNGFGSLYSDHAVKQKWCGGSTGFLKKEMSEVSQDNVDWKATKIAKLSDDAKQQQNLLSFSSPKVSTLPYFQHPNSFYSKNAGYTCSGNLNASTYFLNGVRGPFTPSQWFELEQQALIYKYIIANEPIPPNLLIPIRRAFDSAGFSSFSGGLLRPYTFGWGSFHLGFANSSDPEPGRCRRTDGKKWRCSKDAVPDQKYCERHMNRGRHRSRKPVEGLSGHSISGATTSKTSNSTTNVMNMASSSCALVVPGDGPSNSFAINLNKSKDLQPVPSNHLPSSLVNRFMVNKANSCLGMQDSKGLNLIPQKISLNSSVNNFSVAKSAVGDFSFLTSDAIFNTKHKGSSQPYDINAQRSDPQHSQCSFMDDQSSLLWPKVQTQTDSSTQLSISIPPADFMSSTSSPTGEGVALSPLRLSRELGPVQMGLGESTFSEERTPSSWGTSLGGPLGEVLKTTTSSSSGDQSKSVLALNLLSKGWEGSPQLASSPRGVLQRTALGYFSNSSAGSSPQAENGKALESSTLSGDLIGFTLGSSSSLPIL